MKKLVFDDLQPQSGEKYIIREIDEESASPEPVPTGETVPSGPSGVTPYQGFAAHKHEILPTAREFQMSDFFDIDSDIYRGDPEPRTEFNFLLHKVLTVIKEVLFAHSVVFLWANREKGQMVIEARVSDGSNFITSRRFVMGHDLASKVAESGRPELVTEVNPPSGRAKLPYYGNPHSIKTFLGVPVDFSPKMKEKAIQRAGGGIPC